MVNDYQFNFTDTNKTSFVVKPYTINGYETPGGGAFYTTGGVTAVSANTSLVFVGKGMPEYGDAVQNNFVYLLENFANVAPPVNPTEGQIWYKNNVDISNPEPPGLYVFGGTVWDKMLVETSTGLTGNLNMGGFTITNVGGWGAGYTAATESYVDAGVASHAADSQLHLSASQNVLLDGISVNITSAEINHLDGVVSPIQTQIDSKLSLTGGTLTGPLTLSADPVNNLEPATKQYVDAFISLGSDGVVNAGSLNPVTGVLTLGRTVGAPVVVVGDFAPWIHMQEDVTVTHDVTMPVNQSFLYDRSSAEGTYPTPSVYESLKYLEQATYSLQRPVRRQLFVSSGSGFTPLTLNPSMLYTVGSNRLQVYVNGVKQYMSERGNSSISYFGNPIGLVSDTGLAPSSVYTADINVDSSGPVTISISTSIVAYTFSQLLYDVNAQLVANSIPATATIEQFMNRLVFTITSSASGLGSSVTTSFATGELFESIVADFTSGPVDIAITADYAYEEVGDQGTTSNTLQFATDPVNGSVVEVLVFPT